MSAQGFSSLAMTQASWVEAGEAESYVTDVSGGADEGRRRPSVYPWPMAKTRSSSSATR